MKNIGLALLVSATAVLLGPVAEPATAQDCVSCAALRQEGQASFQIVLENADGGPAITYSGLIRDRGRSIIYSRRTKLGSSDRLEKFEWTAAD